MEYPKEYGIEGGECRYGLATIESCRKCLFETLCRLEKTDSLVNKRKKSEGLKQGEQVLDPNNK